MLYSFGQLLHFSKRYNRLSKVIKADASVSESLSLNQCLFRLKEKLQLKTPEDWNSITQLQVRSTGGSKLLNNYSLFEIKCMGCPEGKSMYDTKRKSLKYWDNIDNVKKYLELLKNIYKFNSPEDWNKLSCKIIQKHKGGTLLLKYKLHELKLIGSSSNKFHFIENKPKGYWKDENNIKIFMESVKSHYHISSVDDWHLINKNDIINIGGRSLFLKYSLFDLKCLICPEYKKYAQTGRNNKKPVGHWGKKENIIDYLNKLKEKYKINSIEDWNRLSRVQFDSFPGGRSLLMRFSRDELVPLLFPEVDVKSRNSSNRDKRSNQRWLFLQVQKLFNNDEIIEDFYHENLSRISNFPVQFDIYIVNKRIAIEYHGIQHYNDLSSTSFASLEMYKLRDKEKQELCKANNITLFIVPYWCDNSLQSLSKILEITA